MGLFADKLEYLEGTKTAIKNAIIAKGTPVSDSDTFRSYATKINTIDTFSDAWVDQQDVTVDMKKFKKILEDDVQSDQGDKKILFVTRDKSFGFNAGLTSSYDKITGFKIVGGKYYTRSEMDSYNNGDIYCTKSYSSRYQAFGSFCVIIIYFDNSITQLDLLDSLNGSNLLYICSKNINISNSCLNYSDLLYDMINCRITTTNQYFDFTSSFPSMFINSEYLQENVPITFYCARNVSNIDKVNFLKNPLKDNQCFQYAEQIVSVPNIVLGSDWTSLESFFSNCYSLKSIGAIDTSKITNMESMFDKCCSLVSIPSFDTSKITSAYCMFQDCVSLKTIPKLNLSSCTNASYMFNGCRSLESVEFENATLIGSAYSMFNGCKSLKSITGLDCTKMNEGSLSDAFKGCISLETLGLTNIKSYLDLSATTKLTKDAIISIFNNLVMGVHPYEFKLSKPSYALLSVDDIKIANDKDWVVYDERLSLTSLGDISGTFTVGSTLTAGAVIPSDAPITYQWMLYNPIDQDCSIEGATSNTYVIKESDAGNIIRLTVRGNKYSKYFSSYIETTNTNYVINPNDTVPPTVTNTVQSSTNASGKTILAQSSESTGYIYIVQSTQPQTTLFEIQTACRQGCGSRKAVTAANTDISVSVSYLPAGTYYAYAVDSSGNVSTKGTNAITITAA